MELAPGSLRSNLDDRKRKVHKGLGPPRYQPGTSQENSDPPRDIGSPLAGRAGQTHAAQRKRHRDTQRSSASGIDPGKNPG
ncbi:hypothetical protein A1Q1_04025 [Trichosporon asahii var. asahii CBS 2479]|uniref:Uncharacterized protein n=1 Tax=Trichosporon asahii var. asahii (strain ATCC 90039 / CBS 2479 / JCM 2466 / KCTC 7840 / NBRC 103889/ NCYC 2677 / UAMH 7654) TaxID=1186058 RepID=J6EWI0_TRIAS|nr:hypothetical protein A1Q1_04025 [Trichosporon asahii var. asahii CBS 2479]EJT47167.1 hypothetical protein A1Q1_04025 [Trichosporon asahii var. asahii CBS 2479]